MRTLQWSASDAVFIEEIDDEHKEIFAAVADLQKALSRHAQPKEIASLTQRLTDAIAGHFAHEERLMRAARYGSIGWHTLLHGNARRRVGQYVGALAEGDPQAGPALVEYLSGWLQNHARLADRMMGAFLRNRRRCVRMTFRMGTKPADACEWVDSRGERFDPNA